MPGLLKTSTRLIVLLAVICYASTASSNLVKLKVRTEAKSTTEEDYITAYQMTHLSDSKWTKNYKTHSQAMLFPKVYHTGIFILSLRKSSSTLMVTLLFGETKQPLEFMIDTGNILCHFLFFQSHILICNVR